MSVYNDISQDDASSVEMKKKTKEMKIRVAKVIFVAFNKFIVIERFAESALNHSKVYQQVTRLCAENFVLKTVLSLVKAFWSQPTQTHVRSSNYSIIHRSEDCEAKIICNNVKGPWIIGNTLTKPIVQLDFISKRRQSNSRWFPCHNTSREEFDAWSQPKSREV